MAISMMTGLLVTFVQFRLGGSSQPTPWVTIAFENPSIHVQFPVPPRHRVEQVALSGSVEPVPQGIFTAQGRDGVSYSLSVITYPEEALPAQQDILLRSELSRLVPGAALTSFELASVSGMDARDFVMQNNAEGTYIQGRIIRKDATLFALSVIYTSGYFPSAEYEYFIRSFTYDTP